MRDHKIDLLNNGKGKNSKKNNLRRKSFGYQILGFGSGGGGLAPNPFTADYLMVAGGGAGRGSIGGGGGAGGLLYSYCNACAAGLSFDSGLYNITIGGGGSAGQGNDTTIISAAGALMCISKTATKGGYGPVPGGCSAGGSGSGGGHQGTGGSGNTPPVSAPLGGPQGNNGGGAGGGNYAASGGGGRGGTGVSSSGPGGAGGSGGVGIPLSISGSAVSYAGGGGGGAYNPGSAGGGSPCGTGGSGIPGTGPGTASAPNNGDDNTGGGGGGNGETAPPANTGDGGSGVVILRYPNAIAPTITVAPGTNTTSPVPGCQTAATFTVTGTFCAGG